MTTPSRGDLERAGRSAAGFTLIELLVATTVTVVLATMLISITTGVLKSWNQSRGRLTSSNQAKVALDQLAQDIEGIVLRSDGNVWFAATITGGQTGSGEAGINGAAYTTAKPATGINTINLAPSSGELSDYRFGHIGVWLRFFANQQDSNANSDDVSALRAIAYQIARLPVSGTSGNPPRYFLFRSDVRANKNSLSELSFTRSTFTTGYDIVGNNAYNNPTSSPAPANSGQAEPGSIRRPDRTQVIGNDVIDFGVRVFSRNSSGVLIERFPVDRTAGTPTAQWALLATNAVATPTNPSTAPSGLAATPVYAMPAVIEVMVRILTDEGAQLIVALETGRILPPGGAGNFDTYWWELAQAHSQVFTRRVEVKGASF